MNKKLIVLSAPSGAGKTTLCERLLRDFPMLVLSVSSTTRPPRGAEKEGQHYHFVTHEEFKRQIEAGRFAEWALVHGNYYGTSKDVIEKSFREGKVVLLDIDVQGAESLRQAYPGHSFTVFISPPDLETLEKRLRARGTDNEATIQKRLQNARDEMKAASRFEKIITNDHLDRAYDELKTLIREACFGSEAGHV